LLVINLIKWQYVIIFIQHYYGGSGI